MLFADAEFEIHTIHLISLKVMKITPFYYISIIYR
nr:MAG TPA: hypothetical protein [Caudoviricetes sp.]